MSARLGWGREGVAARRHSRGQAMVEFAILIPFLFTLVLGSVDFGRVFGQNAAISGAAREAARQAVVYDPTTQTNPEFGAGHEDFVRCVALHELGYESNNANCTDPGQPLTLAPGGHQNDCFTADNPPAANLFPSTEDTGYIFVCWETSAGQDNAKHVVVTIAWTESLLTPFVQHMVGTPHLHSTVEATEQSPT